MKELDILVFGASGYTGKVIVETLKAENEAGGGKAKVRFGVCGRNREKLQGMFPEETISVADVGSESAMVDAFGRAKVVINATGPYRFWGLAVMQACLLAGAHYVDVCGEPAFLENAVIEFDARYKAAKLVAIGSAGFDSIPADIGTAYSISLFPSPKLVNLVRSYHILHHPSTVHVTTYEALVHSISNGNELLAIRKKLPGAGTKLPYSGPKRPVQNGLHRLPDGSLCLPFPGADASVVKRTQTALFLRDGTTPVQYHAYLVARTWLQVLFFVVFNFVIKLFAQNETGKDLLLRYPEVFSCGVFTRDGPTEEDLDKSTFEVRLVTEGWHALEEIERSVPPSRTVVTRLEGREPFYRFTAFACIQCARCVLEERDRIPDQGGVMTPWQALQKTTIIDRLRIKTRIETVSDV